MRSGGGGGGGFSGHQFNQGNFHSFNMRNADDIFKEFFGGQDPFAQFFNDDNDGPFGSFGKMGFGEGMNMH
jgi:hypothetical protein